MLVLALLAGGAIAQPSKAPAAPAPTKPQRIVSLNLCTDQLLMQMVDAKRIRALTYLSRDPRSSGMAAEARTIPVAHGAAEEVIAMKPDLVLAGTFSTRNTVALLRRMGYNVVELEPETDFAGIETNIRTLARAVGEPERGARMIGAIRSELASIPKPPGKRPVYANYDANGYTSGDGSLLTEVANTAGFDTLAQRLGLAGSGRVSLEQMLVSHPDLIDVGEQYSAPALATQMLKHPALRRLLHDTQTIDIPSKYTVCGTMLTLRAVRAFVAARQNLE